jgi:hypothetical protein
MTYLYSTFMLTRHVIQYLAVVASSLHTCTKFHFIDQFQFVCRMDRNSSQSHVLEPMIQEPKTGYCTGSTGSSDDECDEDSSASGTHSEDELASLGSKAMKVQPAVEKRLQKPRKQN